MKSGKFWNFYSVQNRNKEKKTKKNKCYKFIWFIGDEKSFLRFYSVNWKNKVKKINFINLFGYEEEKIFF